LLLLFNDCSSNKIAPLLDAQKLPMLLAKNVDVFGAETDFLNHILSWWFLNNKILILLNTYQFICTSSRHIMAGVFALFNFVIAQVPWFGLSLFVHVFVFIL
jgi:hypothetical protein